MTIYVVRPHHRVASVIGSRHDSFVRNLNPFCINSNSIVAVLAFPIGVVNALGFTAVAAGPLATVQTFIPAVQLRALIIVAANMTD